MYYFPSIVLMHIPFVARVVNRYRVTVDGVGVVPMS